MPRLDQKLPDIVRRYFPVQYIVPVAVLLVTSFSCLFALLLHLTSVQDRMAQERESGMVRSAIATVTKMVDRDLRDYARWDEAVRNLVLNFNNRWADDNLGPYLGKDQGYDYVVVVDGNGRPVYSFHHGKRQDDMASVTGFGPSFLKSLAAVQNPAGKFSVSGFSRSDDNVYIYAVAAITPLTEKVQLPDGPRMAMIIASSVDKDYIEGRFTREQHTPYLTWQVGQDREGMASVEILDAYDRLVGKLIWVPRKPGSFLREDMIPGILAVAAIFLVAAGGILRHGRLAIEALQNSEARARHLANHDTLTGFANRRAMMDQLDSCMAQGTPVTMLYLDLDGFKETNDLYGHGAGDELLRVAAERIRSQCPSICQLARVGGDEFAILFAEASDVQAQDLAKGILRAFEQPFPVVGYSIILGVSIGIANNADCFSAAEVVRRADVAMYAAKGAGKNCCKVYDPLFDNGTELRKRLENDLREAIEQGQIYVVFQPIVSARDQKIVSVEALARWTHPVRGMVPPDQFIPIAEECGLIVNLGRMVLERACREAKDWGVDLSVNLSPAQFWDRDLTRTVKEVLAETGFPARRLELEITESYLLRRPEAACEIIDQLRHEGIRIALDDFGTGFSSIGYLQRLSFDSIKIDRSFIAKVTVDKRSADMVRAIVAIGAVLNLPVTAEGIETSGQASLMYVAGCSRLQGWLFGKPVPARDMSLILAERGRRIPATV